MKCDPTSKDKQNDKLGETVICTAYNAYPLV